ncbi:hypothetical protein [Rugosimonospora acidiphila]|uniref:hypothetical protein n=1 Tax=Rugosimonospora acidiphila TaxID=556531 RepID=UPI0031E98CC0
MALMERRAPTIRGGVDVPVGVGGSFTVPPVTSLIRLPAAARSAAVIRKLYRQRDVDEWRRGDHGEAELGERQTTRGRGCG